MLLLFDVVVFLKRFYSSTGFRHGLHGSGSPEFHQRKVLEFQSDIHCQTREHHYCTWHFMIL